MRVADGSIADTRIIEACSFTLELGGHSKEFVAYVVKLGRYPVVLGMPWMQWHEPTSSNVYRTWTFDSLRCGSCRTKMTNPTIHCMHGEGSSSGPEVAESDEESERSTETSGGD
jgi:hypothetical protein